MAALAAGTLGAAQANKPNVILILLDDLGWADLGCYGNRVIETPNIDRLAADGVRFTNAYAACPVCSPTRASILTGKYPARLHLTDWIPGRKQWPHAKLLVPEFEQQLPLKEITIAEALRPFGYQSASIGKWHLGATGFGPEQQGFQLNVAGTEKGSPPAYFGPFALPGLKSGSKEDFLTEMLTAAAGRFIDSVYERGPFFLYLPEFAVHTPLQARPEAVEKYRKKDAKIHPVYAAMVESVDQAVGRIRKKLVELGIQDNTILVLTSDNGGLRYEGRSKVLVTDNSPLRAGKGHLYEGGIRDPLLIYWPGVTKPGRVIDTPVSSIDLLPTILEMAGAQSSIPKDVDGVSLAPLLRGGPPPRRDELFWHYPHYSNQGGVPSGAIRRGDFKLIEFYEDGRLELFNLREDPGERVNLVRKMPATAKDLHRRLQAWRQSVKAAMPKENPNYDPAMADQGLTGVEPITKPSD